MSEKYINLFTPIKIGKLQIKNRYAMSPIVPMGYVNSDGAFNERGVEYYVERAKGGTGLIITGVGLVDAYFEGTPIPTTFCPTQNSRAFMLSANEMTERIQAYGAKIFLQLGAGMGRAGMPFLIKNKVSASKCRNRWDTEQEHREMTVKEINNIVKKYGESSLIAKNSGFDGVEVHAVHEGYLLDQFAISLYNKRTDKYGGCLEDRLRFAVEILQEIKKVCGNDFPVSLRYSVKSFIKDWCQGAVPKETFEEMGRDVEEGLLAAKILEKAGYDAFNADVGTYDSWYWNHPPMYFEDGMYLPYSQMLKKVVSVPVITSGRMDNPTLANKALRENMTDIISLGRPLLADPYLPNKVKAGNFEDVRPCLSCHEGCQGRVHKKAPITCAVNPSCGRENIYGITKADKSKTVMIIGGGISGMEAARVAALRGHKAIIFEKTGLLGGNVIPGGKPDFKKDDRRLIEWYKLQLDKLKVEIRYNEDVNSSMLSLEQFDTLIIATGSTPIKLKLEGNENVNVYSADEILNDISKSGKDNVIIGAGLVGGELALWLSQKQKNVTLIEATDRILGGPNALPFVNYDMLKDLLNFHHVKILLESMVLHVNKDGVLVKRGMDEVNIKADTVITSVGYKSNNKLYEELKRQTDEIYLLGDAKNVKNIHYAIWDAYEVARNI